MTTDVGDVGDKGDTPDSVGDKGGEVGFGLELGVEDLMVGIGNDWGKGTRGGRKGLTLLHFLERILRRGGLRIVGRSLRRVGRSGIRSRRFSG